MVEKGNIEQGLVIFIPVESFPRSEKNMAEGYFTYTVLNIRGGIAFCSNVVDSSKILLSVRWLEENAYLEDDLRLPKSEQEISDERFEKYEFSPKDFESIQKTMRFSTIDEPKLISKDFVRSEEITKKMRDTYEKKNHDYGNSFRELYKECGIVYAYGHLAEKLRRIKSLMKNEAKVRGEGMNDSLYDLANYAIMTIMELERGGK